MAILVLGVLACLAAACGDPGISIYIANDSDQCLRASYTFGDGSVVSSSWYVAPHGYVVPPRQTGRIVSILGATPNLQVTVEQADGTTVGKVDGPEVGDFLVTVGGDLTLSGRARRGDEGPPSNGDFTPDGQCDAGPPTITPSDSGPRR